MSLTEVADGFAQGVAAADRVRTRTPLATGFLPEPQLYQRSQHQVRPTCERWLSGCSSSCQVCLHWTPATRKMKTVLSSTVENANADSAQSPVTGQGMPHLSSLQALPTTAEVGPAEGRACLCPQVLAVHRSLNSRVTSSSPSPGCLAGASPHGSREGALCSMF
ncbi:FXYD domain-containing ion transport regulator 3 isoform X1 [Marmota monax]|uniref:FXYD domain-containing ion transport regulator 3 isoform X1 n=1 Tax=Marmota monax TaxID=9995 RepID=UPI001EAFB20B|nr:FXYD domain-containing ion transport regulator 3 isoform X1 [Marmota monax]